MPKSTLELADDLCGAALVLADALESAEAQVLADPPKDGKTWKPTKEHKTVKKPRQDFDKAVRDGRKDDALALRASVVSEAAELGYLNLRDEISRLEEWVADKRLDERIAAEVARKLAEQTEGR